MAYNQTGVANLCDRMGVCWIRCLYSVGPDNLRLWNLQTREMEIHSHCVWSVQGLFKLFEKSAFLHQKVTTGAET